MGCELTLLIFMHMQKDKQFVWTISFPKRKVWDKLKFKGSKKMLKLDQMLSFSGLNICLESPLFRVFQCSDSYFGMFMPTEKKWYIGGLCLTGYRAEDFNSEFLWKSFYIFSLKLKAFMQSMSVITLKLFRMKLLVHHALRDLNLMCFL